LSKATIDWRRSMRPLTQELTNHKVPYKLSTPRCLLTSRATGPLHVRDASERADILQQLGLTTKASSSLPLGLQQHPLPGTLIGSHCLCQQPGEETSQQHQHHDFCRFCYTQYLCLHVSQVILLLSLVKYGTWCVPPSTHEVLLGKLFFHPSCTLNHQQVEDLKPINF
ncbi:Hypothetical predicted protein, partial [Pelobates cultripes]